MKPAPNALLPESKFDTDELDQLGYTILPRWIPRDLLEELRSAVAQLYQQEIACEDTLQLAVLLDEFAKAISAGRPFKCDGAMGLRDMRIVEAIHASGPKAESLYP